MSLARDTTNLRTKVEFWTAGGARNFSTTAYAFLRPQQKPATQFCHASGAPC